MNKPWAQQWIESFSKSPKQGCEFYADEFVFEDVPLDQDIRSDKAELERCFQPYANTDPANGVGIHRFQVVDYVGDENSGFILWEWSATECATFIGLPTNGKPLRTRGITGHVHRNGKIVREWTHSDQASILKQLGYPVKTPQDWKADSMPGSD